MRGHLKTAELRRRTSDVARPDIPVPDSHPVVHIMISYVIISQTAV